MISLLVSDGWIVSIIQQQLLRADFDRYKSDSGCDKKMFFFGSFKKQLV